MLSLLLDVELLVLKQRDCLFALFDSTFLTCVSATTSRRSGLSIFLFSVSVFHVLHIPIIRVCHLPHTWYDSVAYFRADGREGDEIYPLFSRLDVYMVPPDPYLTPEVLFIYCSAALFVHLSIYIIFPP
jgi:hypothetical protein